ncbi:hypothetical protein L6164_015246 [Bauhinia variegata]|uniref:Uncharacterized protein n=1 Tax=Bauhinia variegata TaxID=167791 RepID=A0ACB9NK26_BAUVA|nr:hypothetical protein L6164_015246 [Bauhinia variegata]
MRGVNRFTLLGKAIRIDSTTISAISSGTIRHRLPQFAPYGTFSIGNTQWLSHSLIDHLGISNPSVVRSIGGVMYSSAAAASLNQHVHPDELPRAAEFKPKEVVLYQYEACPFCNKVTGESISLSPQKNQSKDGD